MAIFNSYFDITRGLKTIKSRETTVFLWFSYGFPMDPSMDPSMDLPGEQVEQDLLSMFRHHLGIGLCLSHPSLDQFLSAEFNGRENGS